MRVSEPSFSSLLVKLTEPSEKAVASHSGGIEKVYNPVSTAFQSDVSVYASISISVLQPVTTVRPFSSPNVRRSTPLYLSLIHISEPTRLGMISYAVFCLKKKNERNGT